MNRDNQFWSTDKVPQPPSFPRTFKNLLIFIAKHYFINLKFMQTKKISRKIYQDLNANCSICRNSFYESGFLN
jgi:hypothetical protein